MRILFLSWRDLAHPLAGGSEVLVDQLAAGLTAEGHEVRLLCGGPRGERAYEVTSVGGTYSHYLQVPLRYLGSHRQADLVVDVVNGVPYLSPLWRRRPSICLVNQLHTDLWALWFPRPVAAFGRTFECWALAEVYRRRLVVAVSPSTQAALVGIGVPPGQIRIVHNGVDSHQGAPSKSAEPLFVALGRLVPHKRYDLLLTLWEQVRPLTGGRLVILGDGPERDRLGGMAGPGVEFPGRVSEGEKRQWLESAWLLMHPSSVEGWGIVVMEAAAFETPTLGFAVPGLRDSVVDGRTGRLAADEETFVRSWIELSANSESRRRLGRAARARARQMGWSDTVRQFLLVADEAVSGGRRPPDVRPAPVAAMADGAAERP
ncbi:MAG TPA: glycosyltransferase family 4 protein [Acidimicrobiales bacterium]|jgi:glycosyltransferase involved in cell wall biosynthesis|nr:glycosyltransferase family 4 protein [Acidimicrobiales bacterium]